MRGDIPIKLIIGDEEHETLASFDDDLIVNQDMLASAIEVDKPLMMKKIRQAVAVKLRELADKLETEA